MGRFADTRRMLGDLGVAWRPGEGFIHGLEKLLGVRRLEDICVAAGVTRVQSRCSGPDSQCLRPCRRRIRSPRRRRPCAGSPRRPAHILRQPSLRHCRRADRAGIGAREAARHQGPRQPHARRIRSQHGAHHLGRPVRGRGRRRREPAGNARGIEAPARRRFAADVSRGRVLPSSGCATAASRIRRGASTCRGSSPTPAPPPCRSTSPATTPGPSSWRASFIPCCERSCCCANSWASRDGVSKFASGRSLPKRSWHIWPAAMTALGICALSLYGLARAGAEWESAKPGRATASP